MAEHRFRWDPEDGGFAPVGQFDIEWLLEATTHGPWTDTVGGIEATLSNGIDVQVATWESSPHDARLMAAAPELARRTAIAEAKARLFEDAEQAYEDQAKALSKKLAKAKARVVALEREIEEAHEFLDKMALEMWRRKEESLGLRTQDIPPRLWLVVARAEATR